MTIRTRTWICSSGVLAIYDSLPRISHCLVLKAGMGLIFLSWLLLLSEDFVNFPIKAESISHDGEPACDVDNSTRRPSAALFVILFNTWYTFSPSFRVE